VASSLDSSRIVKKVVIPVAGLGTRFLPATKALPKELLPIVTKPIIHHIVEECVSSGIETVVFITSRSKVAVEDYFDPGDLTTLKLREHSKSPLIDEVLELSSKIEICSIRQPFARGLGHAISLAEPLIGQDSFAVVLGDDLIVNKDRPALRQCLDLFEAKASGSVVGVLPVEDSAVRNYGVVECDSTGRVIQFIEKPNPQQTSSRLAMPGRYVFERSLWNALKATKPGKNNEIQLTDAMQSLLASQAFYAQTLSGERYDTGDRLGYIQANVAFALQDKELRETLRPWLTDLLSRTS
jgi:UTP--glucose-1-phosphate uridylyltransferase